MLCSSVTYKCFAQLHFFAYNSFANNLRLTRQPCSSTILFAITQSHPPKLPSSSSTCYKPYGVKGGKKGALFQNYPS